MGAKNFGVGASGTPEEIVLRRFLCVQIDFAIIAASVLIALFLRDNFEFSWARIVSTIPYIFVALAAAALIVPVSGMNKTIWRFSSMPDYTRIVWVTAAIVLAAVAVTFAINRLEGVARSLPILHFIIATCTLVGVRVFFRLHHVAREHRNPPIAPLKVLAFDPDVQTILVVGLSRLTETYLQSLEELAPRRIKVAGLLGHRDRHVGRLVGKLKVLGRSEQVAQIVSELEVHGVSIDMIVVTQAFDSLSSEARRALLEIEQAGSIKLHLLSEQLGLEDNRPTMPPKSFEKNTVSKPSLRFEIPAHELSSIGQRKYWVVKRIIDVVGATLGLVILFPLIAFAGIAVAINIGMPITFWQQRPGLGGRPFRLFKFRSMEPARTLDGVRIPDEERTSRLGMFLRKTRLDELPQLLNILKGDMSFIGPRPLLPRDQADAYRARLLVRPGLTGWAQVNGGRSVSAEDKAALDVWYVQNASLSLDLKIALRTIPMIIFGERTCRQSIQSAWQDLIRSDVLKTPHDVWVRNQTVLSHKRDQSSRLSA